MIKMNWKKNNMSIKKIEDFTNDELNRLYFHGNSNQAIFDFSVVEADALSGKDDDSIVFTYVIRVGDQKRLIKFKEEHMDRNG